MCSAEVFVWKFHARCAFVRFMSCNQFSNCERKKDRKKWAKCESLLLMMDLNAVYMVIDPWFSDDIAGHVLYVNIVVSSFNIFIFIAHIVYKLSLWVCVCVCFRVWITAVATYVRQLQMTEEKKKKYIRKLPRWGNFIHLHIHILSRVVRAVCASACRWVSKCLCEFIYRFFMCEHLSFFYKCYMQIFHVCWFPQLFPLHFFFSSGDGLSGLGYFWSFLVSRQMPTIV